MAKNTLRGFLAAVATTALALTGVVSISAPASAASMVVVPTVGTSTTYVSGETFELKVGGDLTYTTGTALRWEVQNPDEVEMTVATTGGTPTVTDTDGIGAADDDVFVVTPGGIVQNSPGGNELYITLNDADDATELTVTSFIETGVSTGELDANDTIKSTPVTVEFIKLADVVATFDSTTILEGDDEIETSLSFNVNNEQLSADTTLRDSFDVDFTKTSDSSDLGTDKPLAAWDKDDKFVVTSDSSLSADLTEGTVVKMQVQNGSTDVGSAVFVTVTTRVAEDSFVMPVAEGTIDKATPSEDTLSVDAALDSAFSIQTVATTEDKDPADVLSGDFTAAADQDVTVAVTSPTLSATDEITLTINGTTYTSNSKLPGATDVDKLELKTNASGVAQIDVETDGLTAADDVVLTVQVENLTAHTVTVTMAEPDYTLSVVSAGGDATKDFGFTNVAGGTTNIDVVVYDQFGGVPAAGHVVRATWDNNSLNRDGTGEKAATAASNADTALSSGQATVSITDNGAGTGSEDYTLTVRELVGSSTFNNAGDDQTDVADSIRIHYVSSLETGAKVTPTGGTLSLDADTGNYVSSSHSAATPGALDDDEASNYDERAVIGSAPSHGTYVDVSGTVANAQGAPVRNTAVTLTGTGLQFRDGSSSPITYGVDSLTVYTDGSGAYTAEVASSLTGKQSVVITSGTGTATVDLYFEAVAERAGTAIEVAGPDAVAPGSTLQLVATITDKFGNPVDTTDGTGDEATVDVNYDGPGFIVGTPTTFETNSKGQVNLTVFLGSNETASSATMTVSYSPTASATTFTGDDDLVVQKTVTIGEVPLAAGEFNAWTKLNDDITNVKFYAKNPSNQGKIQFFFNGEELAWHRGTSATSYEGGEPRYNVEQDAYYLVRDVDLVSGMKNVFEIYQDGERIWRAVKTID